MAKNRARDTSSFLDQAGPYKALLFEVKGKKDTEDGAAGSLSTETFAALSIEEVIAYLRSHRPNFEVTELKVLGKVHVLSRSENLE